MGITPEAPQVAPVVVSMAAVLVSGVVGIGSLIVAGVSAYWAHTERSGPLKKYLYEMQVRAATECVQKLVELEMALEEHHAAIGRPDFFGDDMDRDSFDESTKEPRTAVKEALYRWAAILPGRVFGPMVGFP